MTELLVSQQEALVQALEDVDGLMCPGELDLRDADSVINFLNDLTRHISRRIPEFQNGAMVVIGSIARRNASNNSDIDIVKIFSEWNPRVIDRVRNVLSLVIEFGYGIRLDQGGTEADLLWLEERQGRGLNFFVGRIDDNSLVLAIKPQIQARVTKTLGLGSRGVLPERSDRNHVYDPSVPPKQFRGWDKFSQLISNGSRTPEIS